MQNENPSSDGLNTSTADAVTVPSGNKNYTFSDATSPHLADNPFLSPTSTQQFDSSEFIPNFYSTFSRSSNSPSLTSFDDDTDDIVNDLRLHQASYILEYQQLYNRYTLCLAHLQESIKEVEALHQENESLRLVNTDLDRRLSVLTQATIQNCLLSDFNRFGMGVNRDNQISDSRPSNIRQGSVVETNRPERRNVERVSLPKSISVRSSGYLKLKAQGGNNGGPSQAKARQKSTVPPLIESVSENIHPPFLFISKYNWLNLSDHMNSWYVFGLISVSSNLSVVKQLIVIHNLCISSQCSAIWLIIWFFFCLPFFFLGVAAATKSVRSWRQEGRGGSRVWRLQPRDVEDRAVQQMAGDWDLPLRRKLSVRSRYHRVAPSD